MNTEVGSQSFLQGIFSTQRLNPSLSLCRQILHHLGYQGSPCARRSKLILTTLENSLKTNEFLIFRGKNPVLISKDFSDNSRNSKVEWAASQARKLLIAENFQRKLHDAMKRRLERVSSISHSASSGCFKILNHVKSKQDKTFIIQLTLANPTCLNSVLC